MGVKRIFVCSPYRGDVARNTEIALRLCEAVTKVGKAPFAPHLIYPLFLNDGDGAERARGIAAGKAWLEVCDEMWVFKRLGLTRGMEEEISYARSLRVPVEFDPDVFKVVEIPPPTQIKA